MRILPIALVMVYAASMPATAQEVSVHTLVTLLEGPTFDRDGSLYFTDVLSQRIMKKTAAGKLSVYRENSNLANGLVVDPQNRLIAAEGAHSATGERQGFTFTGIPRVTRTDLRTGQVEIIADRYLGKPLVGPNDVTLDGQGRVNFTDFNGGAVYRVDGPNQLTRVVAAPDVQRPNGLQISPDDKTLYVVEANGAKDGARMIRAFDLLPNGTARNMRVLYNFYPGTGRATRRRRSTPGAACT